MAKQIIVAQRGWVIVGDVSTNQDYVKVENAAVIRRWGTTKGLGEIAANGPTGKTVLDTCQPVTIHKLAVVLAMDCDESKWNL